MLTWHPFPICVLDVLKFFSTHYFSEKGCLGYGQKGTKMVLIAFLNDAPLGHQSVMITVHNHHTNVLAPLQGY